MHNRQEKPMQDRTFQDAQRNDAITWFEIPAADLARATRFYETMLSSPLKQEAMGPYQMAVFPYQTPGIGGCLVQGTDYAQSPNGVVVYVNAAPSIDAALERAKTAGGRIAVPKTELPGGMGFFAHVIDSEGNRVGLHSPG
jgi:hypothetical protein